MDNLPAFQSIRSFIIMGRGILHVCRLDRDTRSFKYLRGKLVNIDDTVYTCMEVNMGSEAGMPPWRKGQEIGLIVVEG